MTEIIQRHNKILRQSVTAIYHCLLLWLSVLWYVRDELFLWYVRGMIWKSTVHMFFACIQTWNKAQIIVYIAYTCGVLGKIFLKIWWEQYLVISKVCYSSVLQISLCWITNHKFLFLHVNYCQRNADYILIHFDRSTLKNPCWITYWCSWGFLNYKRLRCCVPTEINVSNFICWGEYTCI